MSTLKTDTLQNVAGSKSVPMATVVDGSAKAWVKWNGTGTVAILRAFNVSSITDNAVGQFAANFTNPMPDANYSAVAFSSGVVVRQSQATGSFAVITSSYGGTQNDYADNFLAVFS